MSEKKGNQTEGSVGKKERRAARKAAGAKRGGKFKKRYLFLAVAGLLVVGIIIFSKVTAGNIAMPVTCATATAGDIEENISASGKVASARTESYFAPVSTKVGELHVQAGDQVKEGDLLLTFDTADLEQNKVKADMEVSRANSSYQSAMQESNENQNEYSDASIGLDELKQMEVNQKQYVQGLKYELEDDIAARKEDLYEWDKKLTQELNYQNRKLAEAAPGSSEQENIEEIIDNVSSQRTDVQNDLSMLNNEENLKQKQRQIDFEEKKLADMTEEINRRESKQNASEAGILNGYAKQERELSVESAKLSADAAAEDLAVASEGIRAAFDGIVTEVAAVKGAPVSEGTLLFTLESNEQVKVTIELSKYDLEKVKEGQKADVTIAGTSYEGSVERINRMAQNNEQNTPVVKADIKVMNPDGSIFLGVEGKASIHTARTEGAVLVPYEAVNTDKEGDFCYVVKEGVVAKQRIVTGISDDTHVEVKEGLAEGDTVVTNSAMNLEEGMTVTPMLQEEGMVITQLP